MSQSLTIRSDVRAVGPGRLLVSALLPVVAFMAVAHATVEGGSSATMSPGQVADKAGAWVLVSCLWVLPVIMAAVAFTRLATIWGSGRWVRPIAIVGVALLVGHVLAQAGVMFVDTPTLADSRLYALAILLSVLGWWCVDVAAALACGEIALGGVTRGGAITVGVLTGLATVVEMGVYLPALVGDEELHETVGLPPMLLPLMWAALGGLIWRRSVAQLPG